MARNPARNAPCACGSGRRVKHCCGASGHAGGTPATMRHALEMHSAGHLHAAARAYEEVLAGAPGLPDALHMLGVVHLQRGRFADALDLLRRAARAFAWKLPAARHNLGLAAATALCPPADASHDALRERYAAFCDARRAGAREYRGRLSVVVPSHNHAAYVAQALRSVREQTRRPDEIVVVDDGSTDASVATIREALRDWPGRNVFRARENRGAAATINEAVALCSGDYVNVLNSDDAFAPTRLATLSAYVAGTGADLGFARVRCIDSEGAPSRDPRAEEIGYMIDDVAARESVGLALIGGNAAVSSGNLFFSRALFETLGGFSMHRYNHDWDFALRASLVTEPLFVPEVEYAYRLHGANTIDGGGAGALAEMGDVFARFYRDATSAGASPANPFAPVPAVWGTRFFASALGAGHAALLPVEILEDCVRQAQRVLQ